MMGAVDILLDNVQVKRGGRTILDQVSGCIPPGKSTAILGVSGRGKSTLLRAIAGLQPPLSAGKILIGSQEPHEQQACGNLWFLFQEPVLFENRTVVRHMEDAFHLRKMLPDRNRVHDILTRIGLSDASRLYPHQLSVGMRARLAVGMSFCLPPAVLLADEPFASLDLNNRYLMNLEFSGLQREYGSTVVWVTHDVVEALQFAGHILVLGGNPGRVVATLDMTGYPTIQDPANLPRECLAVRNSIRELLIRDGGLK